jgi:hypothetical protein
MKRKPEYDNKYKMRHVNSFPFNCMWCDYEFPYTLYSFNNVCPHCKGWQIDLPHIKRIVARNYKDPRKIIYYNKIIVPLKT